MTSIPRTYIFCLFAQPVAGHVVCVYVAIPFILDVRPVDVPPGGHTGGRSHRISPSSFSGACLNFSRGKISVVHFPRRPLSRTFCNNDLIVLHYLLGIFFFFFNPRGKIPVLVTTPRFELTSQRQKVSRLPTERTKNKIQKYLPRKSTFFFVSFLYFCGPIAVGLTKLFIFFPHYFQN